jgi:putative endonuclease
MKQCEKTAYIYILECSDFSLYTGWTYNLDRRLAEHNKGKASKYTRSRRPVKLVYYEEYSNKQDAMKREYEIKQYSKTKKNQLIADFNFYS